jgi:hypothetical protein
MGKLTIEHLAPYLPYGLSIDTSKLENGYSIMTMCDKGGLSNISIGNVMDEYPYTKPILRPLSDLTKEIDHNGERFVPYYWFGRQGININSIKDERWHIVQKLLSWHFDVFGLIDKGLAVDINTIT